MPPAPNSVPTLRILADSAGVSAATVSMALRNHPRIGADTRHRIQELAERMGYRPDPQVRKLMRHLRTARTQRIPGKICSVWTSAWPEPIDAAWSGAVVRGAKRRAEELGFAWDTITFEELYRNPDQAARKLRARGVEGLFLPPLHRTRSLPVSGPWEHFSIVAASYSILAPNFRRVIPNQFGNMLLLCGKLRSLGYQRIGLCIPYDHDRRQNHHCTGGLAAFHIANSLKMIRPLLQETFLYEEIVHWINREKPDVIITGSDYSGGKLREEMDRNDIDDVAIAITTVEKNSSWAGIDELPERVGSRAIDLLGGMILQNEQGLPEDPSVILIDGIWHSGESAPRRNIRRTRESIRAPQESTRSRKGAG